MAQRLTTLVVTSVLGISTAACSGTVGGGSGGPGSSSDHKAPRLSVDSPVRGTLTSDPSITVAGTAVDLESGVASVTVNGVAAEVDSAGNFTATVPLTAGIGVLETLVADKAGNTARDVRAVLAGPLAPAGTPVDDAVHAHLGPAGMNVLAALVGRAANSTDFTALAQPYNPVYETGGGGCNSVSIDVLSVTQNGVTLGLAPTTNAVGTSVAIASPVVKLRAKFRAVCISGSSTITISANRARLSGALGMGLTGAGALAVAVDDMNVAFDGFDLDVGGIPDVIVNLFEDQIGDKVASMLGDTLEQTLPGLAEEKLAGFVGQPIGVTVAGRTLTATISPRAIGLAEDGLAVALDASMVVDGENDVEYLTTPGSAPGGMLAGADGLGLAVADDLFNQLLAGAWAAGLLERSIPTHEGDPTQIFFGPDTDRLEVALSLPPTITIAADGSLVLTAGDVMIEAIDDGGNGTLAELAVSFSVPLSIGIGADGALTLELGEAQVWAQILSWSELLPRELAAAELEALARAMFGQVGTLAQDALGGIPLPSLAGVTIASPTLDTAAGYMRVRASLEAP